MLVDSWTSQREKIGEITVAILSGMIFILYTARITWRYNALKSTIRIYRFIYNARIAQVRVKKARVKKKEKTRENREREIFDPLFSLANRKSDPTRAGTRNVQRRPESTHPSARSSLSSTRPLMESPLPQQITLVVYLPRTRTKNATKQTSGWWRKYSVFVV